MTLCFSTKQNKAPEKMNILTQVRKE